MSCLIKAFKLLSLLFVYIYLCYLNEKLRVIFFLTTFKSKLASERVSSAAVRRHPPSSAAGRRHFRPPFSPANLGFEPPWNARPNPAGCVAIGAVKRRHSSSRFQARVVHAPPSRRRKLAQLVPAASSFFSEPVSGVVFFILASLCACMCLLLFFVALGFHC